jgi:uncharacterized PurR-regulated membrane protein YhhQ (DUF165 family)
MLALALAVYAALIVAGNLAIDALGVVDVAPGWPVVLAPAAVFLVAPVLVVRDVIRELAPEGRRLAYIAGAIALGVVLSFALSAPALAVASAVAFGLSETLDSLVFERLRRHGWDAAALGSSVAGAVLDSVVFLALAFGSLAFLPGQLLAKVGAIVLVLAIRAGVLALTSSEA